MIDWPEVLDPFCGCGTTIDAAQKLGRDWIGIDISQLAITLIKKRLSDTNGRHIRFVSGSDGLGSSRRKERRSEGRDVQDSTQAELGV